MGTSGRVSSGRQLEGRSRQRGVALITALLVVSLASVAAVSLTASHQLDLRRAETSRHFGQAQLHAASIEALAAALLQELGDAHGAAHEWLDEGCRTPPIVFELEGAVVEVRLEDLHCRLNLNNLADRDDTETERAWVDLVAALNREHEAVQIDAEAVVAALRAWIDPEEEEEWYSRQEPPYRPGNRLLSTPGELLTVRGVEPPAYHALAPYITALPASGTPFNAWLAGEPLRDAFNLPARDELDPADYPLGDYVQLALTVERGTRLYHQCSTLHVPTGRVVVRRLRSCD